MSQMVEQVANAIEESLLCAITHGQAVHAARAAIAAMRDPTESMVEAGAVCPFDDRDIGNLSAEARTIWTAMINAAEGEGATGAAPSLSEVST